MGENNYLMIGAPGSGKGTQAKKLAAVMGLPHIATGELFRDLDPNVPVNKKILDWISQGNLATDDQVNALVKIRFAKPDVQNGYFLDGYPRNVSQAEYFKNISQVSDIIYIEVPDSEIEKRIVNRRVCKSCKAEYHLLFIPPKVAGQCDKCNGELYQRKDDNPEAVKKRLIDFHGLTEPVIPFYEKLGVRIHRIDGLQKPEKVFEDILESIGYEKK
ncbi:nucleoside monophosphate kinase [Candidatus Woesearchaeota archaeon]|nr:nucleoside monophosphate kinase [Candidatus Woesearchaeota archaeon]